MTRRLLCLLSALSLVTAACGSSSASDQGSETTVDSSETSVAGIDESESDEAEGTETAADSETEAADGDEPDNLIADPRLDFQATLDEFASEGDGGAVVLLRLDGETVQAAAGEADNAGTLLDPADLLRVGSVSKMFVAAMVLQMVEEGTVDLEAPLSTYLPDTTVGATSSIRQLLSHQSGIPNYTDQGVFFETMFGDLTVPVTQADVLSWVDGVEAGPVDTFAYSNTNYILLGQLIESIDAGTLNASLATRITEPLGLADTVFSTLDEPAPSTIVGGWSPPIIEGDATTPYTTIETSAWAAGSLISSTSDLADFLDGLFEGSLISEASLAEMVDVGTAGYGLGIAEVTLGGEGPAYGHGGGIPGYLTTTGIEPSTGNLIIIITNNDQLYPDDLASRILLAN